MHLQKAVDNPANNRYNNEAYLASVAQSVVHLTRNEKVACSSQVTSSNNKSTPPGVGLLWLQTNSNHINAAGLWTVSGGSTEPNLNFHPAGMKMQTSQVTSSKYKTTPTEVVFMYPEN